MRNTSLANSRDELLNLRSSISESPISDDVYHSIKKLGIARRSRGRRAGTHMFKNSQRPNTRPEFDMLTDGRLTSNSVENEHSQSRNSSIIHPNTSTNPFAKLNIHSWNAQSIRNKTAFLVDHILEHDVDIVFITETWILEDDRVVIGELALPGYEYLDFPRGSVNHGGGIGILYKKPLKS